MNSSNIYNIILFLLGLPVGIFGLYKLFKPNKNQHFLLAPLFFILTIAGFTFTFPFLLGNKKSTHSNSNNKDVVSSNIANDLSKLSKEEIINILCKYELNEETDISGSGIIVVETSLKMNPDKTFKYSIVETSEAVRTRKSRNAKGTYELVGNVEKFNTTGWKDKYGDEVVGDFQYKQIIKFKGITSEGVSFNLTALLVQFCDQNILQNKMLFSSEDYSSSEDEDIGIDNFKLPNDFLYF
jgi:hypothetical protein